MAWPGPTAPDAPAPLGLGTAPLGGLFTAVEEDDALATVRAALARGVTVVDTAPFYGAGLSEERVGRVWRDLAADGRPLLSTKVGRILVEGVDEAEDYKGAPGRRAVFDWTEGGIRGALEGSLHRLGVDRVDIAHAHDPDDHEEAALATGFPTLHRLKEEGLVAAVGSGMNQAEMLLRFVERGVLDVLLLAGRWTLLDHTDVAARLLDRCRADGVGVMLGGVLNSGLLAGGDTFDYRPAPPEVLARRDALAARCREHGVDLEHAAIRFAAGHPAVSAVLVGARTRAEVEVAADRHATPVPAELWDDLRRHGLLGDSVPDPLPVVAP